MFLAAAFAAIRVRMISKDEQLRSLASALVAAVVSGGIASVTFDLLGFGVATGLVFTMIGASGALLRVAKEERRRAAAEPATREA
jgi:hypothetical protein